MILSRYLATAFYSSREQKYAVFSTAWPQKPRLKGYGSEGHGDRVCVIPSFVDASLHISLTEKASAWVTLEEDQNKNFHALWFGTPPCGAGFTFPWH